MDTSQESQSIQMPTAKKQSSTGLVITVVVILIIVGLWVLGRFTSVRVPGVPKQEEGEQVAMELQDLSDQEGKWQAVFLTNGQVYFGRLKRVGSQFARIEEVYYLQVQQPPQPPLQPAAAATATGEVTGVQPPLQPQLVLIKFGTELHRPEDFMEINRDHILFWEDLTLDSTVVKSIVQYKQQQEQGQAPVPQPTTPAPVQPVR